MSGHGGSTFIFSGKGIPIRAVNREARIGLPYPIEALPEHGQDNIREKGTVVHTQ